MIAARAGRRTLTSLAPWLVSSRLLPALTFAALAAWASDARANGRMPGANDVLFDARDPAHLVARATYGIVQTFDDAASWSWICEQAIDVSGVVADPPLSLLEDGSLLLLPPTGSALISRDRGCTWTRVAEPLAKKRGVDLTLAPSDPKRVLLLMSTLSAIDAQGFGVFANEVFETRDNGQTFQSLATLPSDFEAETLELAKSDPLRLYVSGTAANNPRLGVLLRSEDGGAHFERSQLDLPAGSGSLFISAIHPRDPDRLWLRVPARGDTIGILPARLYASSDKGQSFQMLAATQRAMFGFALSPDGGQLAYGGPSDGLYVGAADGSAGFAKQSSLGVRCLRWTEAGLYACSSEPADGFSLGVSTDAGKSFRALYKMSATCPQACGESSAFAATCAQAWDVTGPYIGARMCGPDAPAAADAGPVDAEVAPDAESESEEEADSEGEGAADPSDAGEHEEDEATASKRAGSGCGCRLAPAPNTRSAPFLTCLALGLFAMRGRRRRERQGVRASHDEHARRT